MPKKNIIYYRGNPNLKACNVSISFTENQILEYYRCKRDPVYFVEHYMKIISVDKGVIPFEPYLFQRDLLKLFTENPYVCAKIGRQLGKSTVAVGYLLWEILFHPYTSCAILANKALTARELLGRLQMAYEMLPFWLQQGIKTWNKGSIVLENGSEIIATSTSSTAIRGKSLKIVFMDEYAFVPTNIAEEFFTSVFPTLSSGKTTKMIVVSTPCGLNHFYKLWVEAEQGRNGFKPYTVHYSSVPGRDEVWAANQKAILGEQKFNQEVLVQFLGSQNTLISAQVLQSLVPAMPVYESPADHQTQKGFTVYKKPVEGHIYVAVTDSGHGRGLDYSTVQVIDCTNYPMEQVAVYRNNDVSLLEFPNIVLNIGKLYNWAEVLVETNEGGGGGQIINTLLMDLDYPNLVMIGDKFGVDINKKTKLIGCSGARELIENYKLIVNDLETISELSNFIAVKKSYQADEGHHDDLVMPFVSFGVFAQTEYFKGLTNMDIRRKLLEQKERMIEDNMAPLPMIIDGTDPYTNMLLDMYEDDGLDFPSFDPSRGLHYGTERATEIFPNINIFRF